MSALAWNGADPIGEPPRCASCGRVPPKLPEQTWAEWEALTHCDGDTCDYPPLKVARAPRRKSRTPAQRDGDRRCAERYAAQLAALIEDVEWLLDPTNNPHRSTADEKAARVGYAGRRASLVKRLRRAGRDDLANPLEWPPA